MIFPVSSDHAVQVTQPSEAQRFTLLNDSGGDTVYWSDSSAVSSSSHEGEVKAGESVNLSLPKWIVSAGHSVVQLIERDSAGDVTQVELEGEQSRAKAAEAAINTKLENQAVYNVKNYGAKGDNATDDAAAFQAAHDAAPAGSTIKVPGGFTYRLASTINITKSLIWDMRGATIRRSAGVVMLEFKGTVGEDVNLTADAAKGATTLSVSTTGLAVGDYLNLRSNLSTGAPSGSTQGEIVRVKKIISGAELELTAPTATAYAKADTARVAKLSFLDGCAVLGGTFTQNEALTKDSTKGFVNFLYTRGATMVDPISQNHEQFAFQFDASLDWKVVRPVLRDMLFNEPEEQYGYGILARGPSQGGEVINATGESAQVFNTGGTTRGFPRHCKVTGKASGNHPSTVAKSPFSLHSDCAFMTMDIEIDGWDDIALQVKGTDHTINAKVRRALGVGIFFVADSKTIYPERITLNAEVEDVKAFEANIGIGVQLQGVGHKVNVYTADTDAHGVNVNRSAAEEPCSDMVIDAVCRNYSRGNPSSYNGVRLGPTGVTNITVRRPFGLKAPEGARLVRFEGGEANNTGCRLISPLVESGMTSFGESEWYAVEGVKPGSEALASAEELKPNPTKTYIEVTGTATIKKIKKTFAGHVIVLNFTSTAKVLDGENLKLAGEFSATADDCLTLICGGNNWYEVARSAN